jgi:hypothetical protein
MGNYLSFKREFGLIVVGAIIFTASFLWKDLFKDVEEKYFPKEYGLTGRVLFTLFVTILLVLSAVHLRMFLELDKELGDFSNRARQAMQFDDSPSDAGGDSGGDSD